MESSCDRVLQQRVDLSTRPAIWREKGDQSEVPRCNWCFKKAEIFQVTGDYCLQCWQEETHPDV